MSPGVPPRAPSAARGDARAVKARDEGAGAVKLPAVHRREYSPYLLGGFAQFALRGHYHSSSSWSA